MIFLSWNYLLSSSRYTVRHIPHTLVSRISNYALLWIDTQLSFWSLSFVFFLWLCSDISHTCNVTTYPHLSSFLLHQNPKNELKWVAETGKYFRLSTSAALPLTIIKDSVKGEETSTYLKLGKLPKRGLFLKWGCIPCACCGT